jgi:hypothetical protein
MRRSEHRFWKWVRAKLGALATWSDSPMGKLARWSFGIMLTIVSIGLTVYSMRASNPGELPALRR